MKKLATPSDFIVTFGFYFSSPRIYVDFFILYVKMCVFGGQKWQCYNTKFLSCGLLSKQPNTIIQ